MIPVRCMYCDRMIDVNLTRKELNQMEAGRPMPHLTSAERELIQKGTCIDCWVEIQELLFPELEHVLVGA